MSSEHTFHLIIRSRCSLYSHLLAHFSRVLLNKKIHCFLSLYFERIVVAFSIDLYALFHLRAPRMCSLIPEGSV